MIQLTPLEETTAVKELIQKGKDEGMERGLAQGLEKGLEIGSKIGLEKGELIGKIQMAQRFLKQSVTPKPVLKEESIESLQIILEKLESELSA